MSDTCGYTVYDGDGEEQPCDRPATGWRWYQGHDHEDALDVACELHENEGGRRIHKAEAAVARAMALADMWRGEAVKHGHSDMILVATMLSATLILSEAPDAERVA